MRFICLSSPFPGSLFLSLEFTARDLPWWSQFFLFRRSKYLSVWISSYVRLPSDSLTYSLVGRQCEHGKYKVTQFLQCSPGSGKQLPSQGNIHSGVAVCQGGKQWAHLLYSLPHHCQLDTGLWPRRCRAVIWGHCGRKGLWPKENNCTKLFHAREGNFYCVEPLQLGVWFVRVPNIMFKM